MSASESTRVNSQTQKESVAQPSGGSGLALVAVAFLAFALSAFLLAGVMFYHQYSIASSWPEIDAQVMRSDVVQIHLGRQTMYDTQLTFVYTLRGEPRVSTISALHPTPEIEPQQARAAEYTVGTHHRVQFNPRDPAQVRLRTEKNVRSFRIPLWIATVGVFFGLIAAAFFVASRRRQA